MNNNNMSNSHKEKRAKQLKIKLAIVGGIVLAAVIGVVTVFAVRQYKRSSLAVSYREDTVKYGSLTVGITESGSLSVGTSEQTFDIDVSAYTGSSSSSSGFSFGGGGGMPGGMPGGGGMPGMSGSSSGSSSDKRSLDVEEVYVVQGQEIKKGAPVLKLKTSSVESIRSELEDDVESAKIDYDTSKTSESSTNGTARSISDLWNTYGNYAEAEYEITLSELQDAVDEAQEKVDSDVKKIDEIRDDIQKTQESISEQKQIMKNAEYVKSTTSREGTELYSWVLAEDQREDAEEAIEDFEDELEDLQDQLETYNRTLLSDQRALKQAEEAKDTGAIDAAAKRDELLAYYENASGYYDLSIKNSALSTEIADTDYNEAVKKLAKFNDAVSDSEIVSKYEGIIESVSIAKGDSLTTGTLILSISDFDNVTVTVSVTDDDIKQISEGDLAKIHIDSFPGQEFIGTVDSIGNASYNNSTGETTYEVKVLINNTDRSLYSDMTAEVTFITKDTEKVLYVSNRAIIREGSDSYVLLRKEDGSGEKTKVVTGFSDGTNVEIKEGLDEGDIVLIESKVSDK